MAKNAGRGWDQEAAQVEKESDDRVGSLLEEIERAREAAEKEERHFTAPTKRQLLTKLNRHNSPWITWQSWNSTSPGGSVNYNVGINNPDPNTYVWLFAHVFVGPANPVADVGHALALVDERFPRLTMPPFSGLNLAPGTTASLTFNLAVPTGIQPSNYCGNTFLFQANWHDVGTYYDRGIFVFGVV